MDWATGFGFVETHTPQHILAVRLLLAAIFGAMIGFEREGLIRGDLAVAKDPLLHTELAEVVHAEGAKVVLSDLRGADELSAELPGSVSVAADVGSELGTVALIDAAEEAFGQVDLFFANAGVGIGTDPMDAEAVWQLAFDVNVHAHRWAARRLLPGWLDRGEGYFCSTASAAGLLAQIGSAPYSVTKHAAVAFAEWLSITYGNRGLKVSCLCPQGVNTAMIHQGDQLGDAHPRASKQTVVHERIFNRPPRGGEGKTHLQRPKPVEKRFLKAGGEAADVHAAG